MPPSAQMTLDVHSWGYRRNAAADAYMPLSQLLAQLASTIAYGGNLLINVGPALDGSIPVVMEARLLALGAWLAVNGEGVYATAPWRAQNDTAAAAYYVKKGAAVYAHLLAWPRGGALRLAAPTPGAGAAATLLAAGGGLPVQVAAAPGGGVSLQLPPYAPDLCGTGSDVAWVVRLDGFS